MKDEKIEEVVKSEVEKSHIASSRTLIASLVVVLVLIITGGCFYVSGLKKGCEKEKNQIIQQIETEENKFAENNSENERLAGELKNLKTQIDIEKQKREILENMSIKMNPESIVNEMKKSIFDLPDGTKTEIEKGSVSFSWKDKNGTPFATLEAQKASVIYPERSIAKNTMGEISFFMLTNGFLQNPINSHDLYETLQIPGKISAFEKNDLKCILSWRTFNSSSNSKNEINKFNITCTELTKEIKQKSELLRFALLDYGKNPIEKRSPFYEVKNFYIHELGENYAIGNIGEISAPRWFAIKKDGIWKITHISQDTPPCRAVEGFPEEHKEDCIDNETYDSFGGY